MKRVLWALFAAGAAGVLAIGGYFAWRAQALATFADAPFGAADERVVLIEPGTGPRGVAQRLARAAVVRDGELAYRLIRQEGIAPKLQAGEYAFRGALTPRQVLEKIVAGEVRTYRVTIPEGLRVDEVLPLLARSELQLDPTRLEALLRDSEFRKRAGVPTPSFEGFLFPDTYTFTRGFTEEAVLKKMVARSLEEYRKADALRSPSVRLDLLEAFTLASIVEKETGAPEERPRIACVFHNRLRLGMKLQTDPTVLYAAMLLRGRFVKNITSRDLVADHPYNTYVRFGLPPGPIANPGAAALRAVLQPLECSDLFFVSRNDGHHVFCPDLRCHNAAVEEWQRRYFRERRGG